MYQEIIHPGGLRISALPADLTTVRGGLTQDPFPVQQGEIFGNLHAQRLHVDGRMIGESCTILFANGTGSLRRPVDADQHGARLIQRNNRFQVVAIECVLKNSMQLFG